MHICIYQHFWTELVLSLEVSEYYEHYTNYQCNFLKYRLNRWWDRSWDSLIFIILAELAVFESILILSNISLRLHFSTASIALSTFLFLPLKIQVIIFIALVHIFIWYIYINAHLEEIPVSLFSCSVNIHIFKILLCLHPHTAFVTSSEVLRWNLLILCFH